MSPEMLSPPQREGASPNAAELPALPPTVYYLTSTNPDLGDLLLDLRVLIPIWHTSKYKLSKVM